MASMSSYSPPWSMASQMSSSSSRVCEACLLARLSLLIGPFPFCCVSGQQKGPHTDGVGPNQSSGLLSVVGFADDLLGGFLAVLGPPLVRGAARPFLGELAGGQFVASADHVSWCLAPRGHVERLSSAPFDLERAIAQYRGHVVHPSLCVWVGRQR